MAFLFRAFARRTVVFFTILAIVAADHNALAAKREGVPKSAPAFTKFMARFIQAAVPEAKVQIVGRLRLDVEMPKEGYTTDLHNIYSTCQRDRDNCDANATLFVAAAVQS